MVEVHMVGGQTVEGGHTTKDHMIESCTIEGDYMVEAKQWNGIR